MLFSTRISKTKLFLGILRRAKGKKTGFHWGNLLYGGNHVTVGRPMVDLSQAVSCEHISVITMWS